MIDDERKAKAKAARQAGRSSVPIGGYGTPFKRIENVWKKNRGLILSPRFWWLLVRLGGHRLRRTILPSSALDKSDLMFVATHHRVMTTYFTAVLKLLSWGLKVPYDQVNFGPYRADARLVLLMQSFVELEKVGRYRGVHIFRDPRDIIVSGYHYHKWTDEPWTRVPDETGETYQDKLTRLDKAAGLFVEIDLFLSSNRARLRSWNTDDPDILELKFEDLIGPDQRNFYERLFAHLGFEGGDLRLARDLMIAFEAGNRAGKKSGADTRSHIRSARARQWEKELEPTHLAYIDEQMGDIVRKFGY